MTTTTQLETVNVNVKNVMDWAISNQDSEMNKVQRLSRKGVRASAWKCGTPIMGEDIVLTSDESRCSESGYTVTMYSENICQIRSALDPQGKRIRLKPNKLVISPSNELQAEVILKSVLRTGSADNDLNPIKSMGALSGGAAVFTRLTSSRGWYVTTDANTPRNGLQLLNRRKMEKSMEGDFETDSMRYKATERYAFFVLDPRAIYGTPGV